MLFGVVVFRGGFARFSPEIWPILSHDSVRLRIFDRNGTTADTDELPVPEILRQMDRMDADDDLRLSDKLSMRPHR